MRTRRDMVSFYLDGMPVTQRLPPKDVIQSIRINANPFSAEFAEPGAGRVEILTKPASEHYHGNGRFEFNDSRLNSRDVFEPTRASYQSRTYEGYVGGPILRDRWGFLAYGGRWDQDDNVVVNTTPLDPAVLQPQPLRLNVAAPTRTTSYSLRSDVRVTQNHTLRSSTRGTIRHGATRDCRAASICPNARTSGSRRSGRRACGSRPSPGPRSTSCARVRRTMKSSIVR